MSFLAPETAAQIPGADGKGYWGDGGGEKGIETQAALPPTLAPQGTKAKGKNSRTTFLGADASSGQASGNMGGKTLMGM